jgi:hypothetical protein
MKTSENVTAYLGTKANQTQLADSVRFTKEPPTGTTPLNEVPGYSADILRAG